ncbi:hypothetical protein JTB14_008236 [Gonioctena quinquepunctata]|nr:hypothetical protein JTB14_008236 [Gonioctena quinquepunctata]
MVLYFTGKMENDDKPLLELQQKFSGLLKLFSHLCEKSKKRTDILEERFKNETIDANTTEEMGIILIEMLKKVKGNLSFLIDSLEKDFNEANQNRTPKLYNDIFTKLLDYRTSVVSVDDNHEYKFVRLGDEETIAVGEDSFRTSIPCLSSTSDLDRTITLENLKGNLPVQSCPSNEVPQDDVVVMSSRNEIDSGSIKESSSTKSEKRYSLSLKNVEGSDGQDTDDSWRDTYGPIHVKPKLSPKEATCDEAHDVDTIKDIILDSNVDDIFEDGHSIPRNGENKSEMDIERECLKSEDGIDMIFSESPTLIATNPENLENGNSNISIAEAQEIEEQENKEKENSNNKTCNESNTICEPQKEIPSGADGKTGGSTNFNWHNSTSSSEESDGSFETVLLSNNDSQSPLKATEIGTRILKIPVEVSKNLEVSVEMKEATKILSETDESSIDSTASSYTIDSTMQITKKNKSKPSKSLPSSQEIETPEPPQSPVAKELEGSDSGNITNSESSTSSDGTERSSSSLTTSSESTKSWSPVYQNATRNSDSIQASGVFDVTSGLDDMDTQAVKNKESSHEIFKSPTSSGDGISCDSGNPRSEAFENLVECEKGENIDSDATEIGGEETEENGANSDVSLERDQHDEDCNAEIGANEESDESDVPLEKPDQQDENPSGESETSRDSIYLEPTQKISKKPKIRIDIEKVQPEKVEDTLPRCSFDIPREGCISDSDTLESNQSDVSDQQTPESVINETKCNEDYENQSCKNKEPVESESNEKDMITHEIENPYSVETVKVDSDEDMDDSQSSKMSEKGSDFLNEHNYSCASVSDIEDSSKDRIVSKPEIEDTDSRETENNGVTEKEESEFDIEDDSDETVELNTNQKINENELDSPLSPPMENLSGNEDSKNSHSDYIHSEHNYSSGASPNPHISSSDTDEDVRNKLISEDMDKHDDAGKGNDIDSDETDIEREINEGIVDESVEIKSIPDLDEISDSQEEVALSQKSTLSYEFDISENTKRLEDLNDALAENENKGTTQECNEDEKKAEDIARELENLLSEEICENKLEGK